MAGEGLGHELGQRNLPDAGDRLRRSEHRHAAPADVDQLPVDHDLPFEELDPIDGQAERLATPQPHPGGQPHRGFQARADHSRGRPHMLGRPGSTRVLTISGSLIPTQGVRAIRRFSTASFRIVDT